jgi:hypothetical protein
MVAVKYFGLERKSRKPKNPNQVEAKKLNPTHLTKGGQATQHSASKHKNLMLIAKK